MQLSDNSVEHRLAQLERSLCRTRRRSNALLVLVAALVTLALTDKPVPPDTVVAKSIHLHDDRGKLRILINARAGVSLLDEEGRPRAVLSVDRSGPGLALYGESSQVGTTLNVDSAGPTLAMRDNRGRTRAMLTAIDQGPALILSDSEGRERVALMQGAGGAHVGVLDGSGSYAWRKP